MNFEYTCPQCGEIVKSLHEGYCEACYNANQKALDQFNFEYDHWQGLSDEERDKIIKQNKRG